MNALADPIPHLITPLSNGNVIQKDMEVVSLCGCRIGYVDRVGGEMIKLNPDEDGQHYFIPREWVAWVNGHIHLNKNVFEVKDNWTT